MHTKVQTVSQKNNDADDVKREKIIHVHLCVKKFFFYKSYISYKLYQDHLTLVEIPFFVFFHI